jgi:hypothetical protein
MDPPFEQPHHPNLKRADVTARLHLIVSLHCL